MGLLCYQFSKGGFLDHFKTREIWDDLVIKWLLGHCIHQHIDFSKGVLFPLWIGPKIIKVIGEIDMNYSSKIGFEVVKLAFSHFASKTQTSSSFSNDSLRKTS